MADFRIFDTYVINYGTQGLPADAPLAFIDCYYQNRQVGQLQFYATTTTFGVGGGYSASIMILYFTIEQYKDAISILRHDSLVLVFDTTSRYGFLDTAQEPLSALAPLPMP